MTDKTFTNDKFIAERRAVVELLDNGTLNELVAYLHNINNNNRFDRENMCFYSIDANVRWAEACFVIGKRFGLDTIERILNSF